MTREYEMDSTSRQSARLADVTLRQTSETRLVARPEIVDNKQLPEAGVKVTLIHQLELPRLSGRRRVCG